MPKMRKERVDMRLKKVFLVALVAGILHASISEAIKHNSTITKPVNSTTNAAASVETSTLAGESLETAPSITSVHQVWTSSSSGSLDELSPEVISKLRQDVPFLAAYALRPRLVGAAPTTVIPQTRQQLQNEVAPSAGISKLDTSSSNRASSVVSAGSRGTSLRTKQIASSSLFPKLGDFSEFNVETSSTSKSEHHHKRKTSLKKRKNDGILRDQEQRSGIGSSQRVKKKRAKTVNADKSLKSSGRSSSRRGGNKSRSRVSASKRVRKLKGNKLNIVKNGRYFQEGSIGAKPDSNELDVEMRTLARDTTTLMMDDGKTSKKNDGTKGGSAQDPDKIPFYASKRPVSKSDESDDDSDEASLSNGRERGSSTGSGGSSTTESGNRVDSGADEEVGDLDDDEPEPKRVGDPDVEEDGDTVLVEPKSDGVDDDPPLPDEDPAGSPDPDESGVEDGSPGTTEDGSPRVAAEGDPRGNRVDRERPNPPTSRANDDDEDGDRSDGGQVVGGGIGSTIGGSQPNGGGGGVGGSDERSVGGSNGAAGSGDRGSPSSPEGSRGGDKKFTESGVEFADDGSANRNGGANTGGSHPSATDGGASNADSGRDDESEFGERRKPTPMRPRGSGERGPELDDDDDEDLDYRDEIDSSRDGARKPEGGRDQHDDERNFKDDKPAQTDGHKGGSTSQSSGSGSHGQHCDDGSYNHHHDHHGAGHHSHHDTIEWLRGAIPGEPQEDYPILNRVNGSNFKCAEQKYPGYYADVESRCQIFHICQADGRQDSFLCPNGTIFSQKTLVCVWWNGFNCEDAPKFYHLNKLLYKSSAGSESPQAAALPSLMMRPTSESSNKMGPLRPRGMSAVDADGAEDDSSIEGLVRMMRERARPHETETIDDGRRGGAGGPTDGARLAPGDEASIQRKSTNLDDESTGLGERASASRLRSRDHIPRRRRRASIRQAPPKLKSRRVARHPRRKLRHGIKPRRRA